jgi:transposase, IS30 family
VPRYAPNKMPTAVKKRYFELIRSGMKGAAAARSVGVSTSCGSLWFLDAGGVIITEPRPISPRFLTQDDRIAIADGLHAGLSKKQIAAGIGKSFQTVYREIRLHSKPDGSYQPWWAHNQAVQQRRRPKPVKLAADPRLRRLVLAKLKVRWSPQQIARYLARAAADTGGQRVCAETIYRALFTGLLGKKAGKLRTGRCCRKPQRRGTAPRNDIPNIRPLSQRPASVEDRVEPGHWEGDLIIGRGQRSAIATLVERTSRFVVLVGLPGGHKAPLVRDALISALATVPAPMRKTLTWDRGRELFWHEQISAATGTEIFFADAHSPWQRGTNENTNGLLRQYFPKRTDLHGHDAQVLARVARELNRRPRLVLGDRTPEEVMRDCRTTAVHL